MNKYTYIISIANEGDSLCKRDPPQGMRVCVCVNSYAYVRKHSGWMVSHARAWLYMYMYACMYVRMQA